MRIEGIEASDLSGIYFMDDMGLSAIASASAVDDNSQDRAVKETGKYRAQDLYFLLEKLNLSQNKLLIIRLLRRGDIIGLLYFLDKHKLINALKFFPREKLVQFIFYLPKELIIKMLLHIIPLKQFLQFFPSEVVFNMLRSKRLEVSDLVKGFENMPPEFLKQLIQHITGRNVDNMKMRELMAMCRQMDKGILLEGLKLMPQKEMLEYVMQLSQKDPELLMMIPRGNLMRMVSLMPKPNLLTMFELLPEDLLVQFVAQLNEPFLSMAASQIDDNVLASILIQQYPDIIASLAEAA